MRRQQAAFTGIFAFLLGVYSRHSSLNHPIRDFHPKRLNNASFGSCNDESKPQALWDEILSKNPELWVFLGDNIYGDKRLVDQWRAYIPPMKLFGEGTPSDLYEKYDSLLQNANFSRFQRRVPIIGTWDDHDYGINDGSKTYTFKSQSQQLFLDFIGEPEDSARRSQRGVYTSHIFGSNEETSVLFILLDVRYNRDPYGTPGGDFLGQEQWTWLERTLNDSTAAFTIIASGIQVLPYDRYAGEHWGRFNPRRLKLLDLILKSNAKGVLLLSGDVHFAEVNAVHCNDRQVYEVTSSGLTHSWQNFRAARLLARIFFKLANLILPFEFRPEPQLFYGGMNFGGLTFDWEAKPYPLMTATVYNEKGQSMFNVTIPSVEWETEFEGNSTACKAPRECGTFIRVSWLTVLLGVLGLIVIWFIGLHVVFFRLVYEIFQRLMRKFKFKRE